MKSRPSVILEYSLYLRLKQLHLQEQVYHELCGDKYRAKRFFYTLVNQLSYNLRYLISNILVKTWINVTGLLAHMWKINLR